MDISYDRNSNITLVEDNVHVGFDAAYTMDDTNRLTRAQEGTWGGSSISSETRDQEWTLSHTGNWDVAKWDLNGDGDFTDTDEYDDTRTHNDVNELTARDTDSDSTDDYSHTYDAVGNMTDDGESYKYEYDAFGRLRAVKNQSSTLLAEYKYNGLGFQVSEHADTNDSGSVNGDDKWFHSAYDERWRKVATFRESDSDPKEEFVNHQAGLSGNGGSSYINSVVCRYKDANTEWTAAADGVLETKSYYFQNWRGDVSAVTNSDGRLLEWAKYSSYGVPIGLPGGDTDSDGDCDATDVTQIQTWIDAPTYDVRGDINLDGDVDADDKYVVTNSYQGKTAGWEVLSTIRVRHGYAGYVYDNQGLWHVRNRVLDSGLGRWLRRDPQGYVDGVNLLQYVQSMPIRNIDVLGTLTQAAGEGSFTTGHSQPSGGSSSGGSSSGGSSSGGGMIGEAREAWFIWWELGLDPWDVQGYNSKAWSYWNANWKGKYSDLKSGQMRHCYMACMLAKAYGPTNAKKMMDFHEKAHPGTKKDTRVDLAANAAGYAIAASGKPCATTCETTFK